MREQGRDPAQLDAQRVAQQLQAGGLGEAPADQEVAVAVHEAHAHAEVGQGPQLQRLRRVVAQAGVVADPVFEQVAEDVHRLRLPRRPRQEARKGFAQRRGLQRQVQIGEQEGGHQSAGSRSALRISTGGTGTLTKSSLTGCVGRAAMRSTTSMPSTTRPNTA